MKKLYLLIAAICATYGNVFAMDENVENEQTVRAAIQNPQDMPDLHPALHRGFAYKIENFLNNAKKALNTDTVTTKFNITANHSRAFFYLSEWVKFFETTSKDNARQFTPQLRKFFVDFKDIYNHEKIAKIEDYPIKRSDVFRLNLQMQQIIDNNSDHSIF
jgi:hypothetical protein